MAVKSDKLSFKKSASGYNRRTNNSTTATRCKQSSSSSDKELVSKSVKCRDYCRKFISFLFSHIGICAIVVAYMIGGAFLFQKLEGSAEDILDDNVDQLISSTINSMWLITSEMNILDQYAWNERMLNDTENFASQLMKAINSGYDDKPRHGKWEFPGAFLFCLTVITTIGK